MGTYLFKDSILAKKYGAFWEVIQVYLDLAANTTLTYTYTLPKGKVLIPVYEAFGDMVYYKLKFTIIKDSEYYLKDILWTPAMEREFFKYIILTPVKHESIDIITNTDVVARTIDLVSMCLLLPVHEYEAFINEVSGRKNLEILEEIKTTVNKILSILQKGG